MISNDIPSKVLNWEATLQKMNHNKEAANELLSLFISEILESQKNLLQAIKDKQNITLLEICHKLHGATCYCIAPKIHDISKIIEKTLQKDITTDVTIPTQQLIDDISEFLTYCESK